MISVESLLSRELLIDVICISFFACFDILGSTHTEKHCYCNIWGDPHHVTFDDREITFQGECEYVLAVHTDAQAVESGLTAFKLMARYHMLKPTDKASYVRYIRLRYNKITYKMMNGLLYLGTTQTATPYSANGVNVILRADGAFVSF